MVNRIWQGHFGTGIVGTPNDFGRQGDKPTNQPLLDWLAVEFMDHGWSVKSDAPDHHEFRCLQDRARTGSVSMPNPSATAFSPSPARSIPKCIGQPVVDRAFERRTGSHARSVYVARYGGPRRIQSAQRLFFVKRSFRLPILDTFDAPDTTESCPRREISTVAPQAFALMNSDWTFQQAVRFRGAARQLRRSR